MSNTYSHRSLLLLFTLLLFLSIGQVWAGGSQEMDDSTVAEDHHAEESHDDHDDHDEEHSHDRAMAIPHIEPAELSNGETLRVVASTSIVGDVVRNVAGSAATVDVLMPVGQNPHAYEPTPRAIATVEDSYITFVNGLDLEEALVETIENVAGTYVVPVSAGITVLGAEDEHEHEDDHDHGHAGGDPHFWFDPTNVIVWTKNIAEALSKADPSNRVVYEKNRDTYIGELETLDREIRDHVSAIPQDQRKLVVDHVALTYFADEYGFEIIGEVIPSVSDQSEPSAQHIAQLAGVIRNENVPAIVIGGTAGRGLRNLVDAVAEEVGREVQIVELLTGSLAPEGTRGDTYVEFVRYNTAQIVSALSR